MKTGSLRARVTLTTLALLAIVLAAVVAAVTFAYRSKLDADLHSRLQSAGVLAEHVDSASQLKPLVPGLALEGVATNFVPGHAGARPGWTIQTQGSLLVLDGVLPDGTRVVLSASRRSINHAVESLLLVEILVALGAFALATFLVVHGTRSALRPLSAIIETATRIAQGDTKLRLEPSRTDSELGSLALAFDRMVDALETAIGEARASEEATRRFLADASHELRTPIAALQASVETLLREQPKRPERDRLEVAVARESQRLGCLVDDLLGLARLEATPSQAQVDLAAVARPLVEQARQRAPQAEITLKADADVTVVGDRDAVERVLRNLIDNALNAIQPNGRIQVGISRRNGQVEVNVADDGPGVPVDERQRIFERFVRLDRSKPGHGLGLAIARRIAEQHHGDLTCDSSSVGARFTLHIPSEH